MIRDYTEIVKRADALRLHFGLLSECINVPTEDEHDDEFLISLSARVENCAWRHIEVVTEEVAEANTNCFLSEHEYLENFPNAELMYNKMMGSEYYFRWL